MRSGCTGVEESWSGMSVKFGGHIVVGLDDLVDIVTVDTNGDSHPHMLRSFNNGVVAGFHKVCAFKSFETEIVDEVVSFVVNGVVDLRFIFVEDFGGFVGEERTVVVVEVFVKGEFINDITIIVVGVLLMIAYSDSTCEFAVLEVNGNHRYGDLRSEFVKFGGGDSVVDLVDDFFANFVTVNSVKNTEIHWILLA